MSWLTADQLGGVVWLAVVLAGLIVLAAGCTARVQVECDAPPDALASKWCGSKSSSQLPPPPPSIPGPGLPLSNSPPLVTDASSVDSWRSDAGEW